MEAKYYLFITEEPAPKQINYRTPAVSRKDAYYWAKRTIELGSSKEVSIWKDNGDFIDALSPKSKETE